MTDEMRDDVIWGKLWLEQLYTVNVAGTGLLEIQFARIVKAPLQLGKRAKSPQTSNPAPGWKTCGDLAQFRPTRKRRATKIAS
jgi:hypothetical protein